jgi:uncharacterized protein with HEPN domain
LENIDLVLSYTAGMTLADLTADRKTSDATERCLTRISEAAIKLGAFAEEPLPNHNWKAIRGIGNVLRHDYDNVTVPLIWDTVKTNLEPLLHDVKEAIARQAIMEK